MSRVFRSPYRERWLSLLAAAAATALVWTQLGVGSGDDGGGGEELERTVSKPVLDLVRRMPLEDKVDGVLLVGFSGTGSSTPIVSKLRDRQLGGVVVSRDNWLNEAQGSTLVAALRTAGARGNRIPPLIAAPQEGGPYRALRDLPPTRRELDVGDIGSVRGAERWAAETGNALREAGFDLNLGLLADVATLDSPIADRAFGDDPELAASMTAAAVRGCKAGRILCAVAHFPGEGAATQDTAEGPATVSLDRGSLEARDLAAFRAAIAERVPAVVLSHAFYIAYDPATPGSLARAIANELLRSDLDYRGAAITDDLAAAAIRGGNTSGRAAVSALAAGADLIQFSGSAAEQEAVRDAIFAAARDGEIPADRLDQAVGRVLELKRAGGLFS
jgi:beta-N-acetylhexosaminidase